MKRACMEGKRNHSINMFPHRQETSNSTTLTIHNRHQNKSSATASPPHHRSGMQNEEADSLSHHSTPFATKRHSPSSANDGASIEVVRRSRGRPPGSKNKPKPPVVITREAEPSMSPYVLEVAENTDVIEAITHFCGRRNIGLCILNGNGVVANVNLKQPSTTPGSIVTFHGHFNILSFSATILPTNFPTSISSSGDFKISLAGPQGQIVGGLVVGPLITAGTIYLIAATFNRPSFHRLPLEDDSGGGNEEQRHQSPPDLSGLGDDGHPPAEDSSGMPVPVYSYQTSDVIWAGSGRQAPPHPPPY